MLGIYHIERFIQLTTLQETNPWCFQGPYPSVNQGKIQKDVTALHNWFYGPHAGEGIRLAAGPGRCVLAMGGSGHKICACNDVSKSFFQNGKDVS